MTIKKKSVEYFFEKRYAAGAKHKILKHKILLKNWIKKL
jgi:hypothetical protein